MTKKSNRYDARRYKHWELESPSFIPMLFERSLFYESTDRGTYTIVGTRDENSLADRRGIPDGMYIGYYRIYRSISGLANGKFMLTAERGERRSEPSVDPLCIGGDRFWSALARAKSSRCDTSESFDTIFFFRFWPHQMVHNFDLHPSDGWLAHPSHSHWKSSTRVSSLVSPGLSIPGTIETSSSMRRTFRCIHGCEMINIFLSLRLEQSSSRFRDGIVASLESLGRRTWKIFLYPRR